jgi:hypothetical protein
MGGPIQHRVDFIFRDGPTSEMPSVELVIFNNKQVTCVGAHVMGTSHDRKSDHAPKTFYS